VRYFSKSEDLKMDDLKQKKALDRSLLRKAVNYYRIKLTEGDYEDLEEWECFSYPSLELHECNSRAKLPGRRGCNSCKNNVDKPCEIACDLQTFCLAVFAWRMGIGGEDFDKSLQRNLYKKKPDELYDEVVATLSGVPIDGEYEDEEPEEVEEPPVVSEEEIKEEPEEEPEEVVKEEEPDPVIEGKRYTVPEVAKLKKCSKPTIYNAMSKGILPFVKVGNRNLILEAGLKDFNPKFRTGLGPSKSVKKPLPLKTKRKKKVKE